MVTVGLMVRLEVKPGKEAIVQAMLEGAVEHIRREGAAVAWFATRLGPSTFGVFDVFADDAQREAHYTANAPALFAKASELFTQPPQFQRIDVVSALLPATGAAEGTG